MSQYPVASFVRNVFAADGLSSASLGIVASDIAAIVTIAAETANNATPLRGLIPRACRIVTDG